MRKTLLLLSVLFFVSQCAKQTENPQLKALLEAGKTAFDQQDYAKADSMALAAAGLASVRGKYSLDWVDARVLHARVVRKLQGADASIDTLQHDLLFAKKHLPEGAGRLHFHIAYAYRTKEAFLPALAHYEQARLHHEHDHILVTKQSGQFLYKPLANIYTRLGEYEKAVTLLTIALDSARQQQDATGVAMAYHELCVAYCSLQQPDTARFFCEAGLDYLMKNQLPNAGKHREVKTQLLAQKARTFLDRFQVTDAERFAQEALTIIPENTEALNILGVLALQRGQWFMADTIFQHEERIYKKDKRLLDRELGKVLVQRAQLQPTSSSAKALALCQEALQSVLPTFAPKGLRDNPSPSTFYAENTIVEALELKSRLQWEAYQAAPSHAALCAVDSTVQLALNANEHLLGMYRFESSTLYALQLTRHLQERALQVLTAQLALNPTPAAVERLVNFSERSRVQLLRQKLSSEQALLAAPLPIAVRQREQQLRQTLNEQRNQLALLQAKKSDQVPALEREIFANEEARYRFLDTLKRQYNRYFSAKYADSVAHVSAIRRLLPHADACLVSYFYNPTSSALYSIGIWADTVVCSQQYLPLTRLEQYLTMLRDGRRQIEGEADPAFLQSFVDNSRFLYDRLLLPVVGQRRLRTLLVVPDGLLGNLPFDLLLATQPTPSENTFSKLPYLVRHTQTRFLPSASVVLQQQGRPQQATAGYWGVAPAYDGYFQPVRYGAACVERLAKAYGGVAITGEKTTKAAFLRGASKHRIVHFYGHGEANGNQPSFAYLAFSPDGQLQHAPTLINASGLPANEVPHVLFAHEIKQQQWNADLVVLSACQTGIGKEAGTEGIFSLARAFQEAGCPSAAMTLWSVDDETTAFLTERFLRYLREGQPKDAALQSAKVDYLNEGMSALPYFWSGFVLTGDASPITFSTTNRLPMVQHLTFTAWLTGLLLVVAGSLLTATFAFKPTLRA